MARRISIWIFGILASGILGGFIGSHFNTIYDNDNGFWGFLAGVFAFACLRLWLGERKS